MRKISFLIALLALTCVGAPAYADSDKDCYVISDTFNPTEAQATEDYLNLTDGTIGTTAAAEDEFIVPVGVKLWGLYAHVDVAPGAGDIWTVTLVDDGTDTLVTCDITGASATTCTNVNNVATVAAGSDLTVLVSSNNGVGDPAAAAEIRVGFCVDY